MRQIFSVTLKGKGINEYKNTFEARKNEILRCKNIDGLTKTDLIREINK